VTNYGRTRGALPNIETDLLYLDPQVPDPSSGRYWDTPAKVAMRLDVREDAYAPHIEFSSPPARTTYDTIRWDEPSAGALESIFWDLSDPDSSQFTNRAILFVGLVLGIWGGGVVALGQWALRSLYRLAGPWAYPWLFFSSKRRRSGKGAQDIEASTDPPA
jgi:hypothetical protein